jgi:hypothetical protein
MTDTDAKNRAFAEIGLCETVLAKGGLSVLIDVLGTSPELAVWQHYPDGDVFDPVSGAQWYYHCHPPQEGVEEHGHFHCFLRPDGPDGPTHHLIAVGVDAHGKPVRLFTVNQWVVGDDWLDAEPTIALLERFDVQMPRPSYLVNRWLTAMLVAYGREIAALIKARDERLNAHQPPEGVPVREDKALEVTSEMKI